MSGKCIYVYLPEGLADWELAFALPELRGGKCFRKGLPPFAVRTFSATGAAVTSMGGLRVMADTGPGEVKPAGAAMLLLPGSDTWLAPGNEAAVSKAAEFLTAGVPVGAICAATVALAGAGLLDARPHTSNDLGFLKAFCPAYKGGALYRGEPSVIGGDLITAAGTAPLEFARDIFKKLGVMDEAVLEAWYGLYKTGDTQYYFKLARLLAGSGR